jgi:CubicO group peptidase (beta-lactamase class C family)
LGQTFDKVKLDQYFNVLEKNDKFMGSIAVARNGSVIYTKTIGYTDVENKVKPDSNTKYRIGSISKTFTTVLVLKAVEQNRLKLDQTLDTFFPKIENAKQITIRDMLYHQSGIHSFTDDQDYLTWNTLPKTEQEMVDRIVKGGSNFKPGEKSEYSNSNFVLLTYIVEKSFKKPFGELLNEYIIKPTGLKNTSLGHKINIAANECYSYRFAGKWEKEPETDISIPMGAGGIVSTPSDLTTFIYALFNGQLLKKESLDQMITINGKYGMGIFKIPFIDKTGYGHTGGIDGFSSVVTWFADGGISYSYISNGSNYNNNNISIAVLSAVYGQPYEIPEFNQIELSAEELAKYAGTYATAQMPLKITVSVKEKTLIAQATGQSSFPLEPAGKDQFKFEQAGVEMVFFPDEKKMVLKQRGAEFNFAKE